MPGSEFHLENAPIAEAIIGIDVAVLSDDGMRAVEDASTEINDDYPQSEPLTQLQFQFGFGPGMTQLHPSQAAQQNYGRKHVSRNRNQLAVFRRNGFSFSRLPPYQRWQSFRDEAKRIWRIYRSATGPVPIVRFGLRYINRVNIPTGQPVQQFLRLYPEVPSYPDGALRTINSSYIRVDSILTEIPGGNLIIQQATLPPERSDFVTLALDFDISVTPEGNVTEEYVWDTFEIARAIKNELFKASLTPAFLETFR